MTKPRETMKRRTVASTQRAGIIQMAGTTKVRSILAGEMERKGRKMLVRRSWGRMWRTCSHGFAGT